MPTTPTQMRLTEEDLYNLERIRRISRLNNRTTTVRMLIGRWYEWAQLEPRMPSKRKRKKSSVAT